ncbi:flagellar biogenesis protein FliO [Chitinivorax tropicus]|uniref:Flagellar biogenesis protein FliO n=1 Tax=Chitinivorax tropicus TaxID=714531 RepID=A0A840MSX9_9PROT|nr:flagellar biosynthetic protein FliO [Chitinivorax tropicus]MBB5020297.1 flagellar biogenesis protein FliO [Chitinivorax tropicus]
MRHLLPAIMTACLLMGAATVEAAPIESPPSVGGSSIPFKRPSPGEDSMVARMVGALAIAGLSALGIALLIRRYGLKITGSMRPSKRLVLQERLRVSPGTQLLVVRFDETDLLIAENANGVTILQRHRQCPPCQEEKTIDV